MVLSQSRWSRHGFIFILLMSCSTFSTCASMKHAFNPSYDIIVRCWSVASITFKSLRDTASGSNTTHKTWGIRIVASTYLGVKLEWA